MPNTTYIPLNFNTGERDKPTVFNSDSNYEIGGGGITLSLGGDVINTLSNLGNSTTNFSNDLDFLLPQYGVQDFINDRAIWQKGTHNLTGEPGWFYFKLFFNFNDTKGLFGGILNNDIIPNTCAMRYLYGIRDFYKPEKLMDRMLYLARFTYTLSYINSICPWFFMGINGLSKLNGLEFDDLGKEKAIEIICNGESVDMRLNTLLDMYKYACYDEISLKEIIPENLRKFDMSIVIMNVPVKYFQTGMMVSGQDSTLNQIGSNGSTVLNKVINGINKVTSFMNGSNKDTFKYKTLNGEGNSVDNRLSFQMYTLKNCEIDISSFENYNSSSMNNSSFSRLGNGSIKIKYDRSYKHTFNEWNQMMYGSDGLRYDGNSINQGGLLGGITISKYQQEQTALNNQKNRIQAIRNSIYNKFFNPDTTAYKALIDFSESVIQDSLINVKDPYYLGNIGDTYNENSYEDMWLRTRDKVRNFFR